MKLATQLARSEHLTCPHAAAEFAALLTVGSRAGSFMTLGSIDSIALLDLTAILFLTISSVRDAATCFAIGTPLTRLRKASIDGPFTQTFTARSVLVTVTTGNALRSAGHAFGELQNALRLSAAFRRDLRRRVAEGSVQSGRFVDGAIRASGSGFTFQFDVAP